MQTNDFKKNELLQLINFFGVGAVATVVHLTVALTLSSMTAINPFVINLLAFSLAFPVSFWGHKHLTFKSEGSIKRFFILAFSGFILNNFILTSLYLRSTISHSLMLCLSTLLTPFLTYWGARLWAFRHS